MTSQPSPPGARPPATDDEPLDLSEKGGIKDGARQSLDRRLYMQLLGFGDCRDASPLARALREAGLPAVLYAELGDPWGVGLLTMAEDPAFFTGELAAFLRSGPFGELRPKPEFSMVGRTYALGYEPDLPDALLARPRRQVTRAKWPWAIWYPLRRSGQFARLEASEQREILKEHGVIGMRFGKADLAHDIRLACHGLDKGDNDFLIGLVGRELHPLSALVQTMRGTQQTALYLTQLGPFFVGRVLYQADSEPAP